MNTISPFMNGESAMSDPVSGIAERRSGREPQQREEGEHARAVPTVAYFRPRDSSGVTPPPASSSCPSPVYGPRRGSITLSLMSATTTVSSTTEAMENQRFDVSEMVTAWDS